MKRGSDKEILPQEVGIDATAQDDWDMQRLGKTQQLKVSWKMRGIRTKTDEQ